MIPAGTTRLLLHTRNSRRWERWSGETPLPFDEAYAGVLPDAARWPGLARYLEGLLVRPAWVTLLAEEADALAATRARRR